MKNNIINEIVLKEDDLIKSSLKLTRNLPDAQDLTQEVIFKAISNIDKFEKGTNLSGWLYTILRNTFINNYRRKKRVINDENPEIDIFENVLSHDNVMSVVNYNKLIDVINQFNECDKVAFMYYYDGYKYKEISEMLNIPIGTVKSQIRKFRLTLIDKLKHTYPHRKTRIKI